MATTTQILFNSPALHSLKRDQLVKLCKIHSLKANGKNTELIDRLKVHAQSLPKNSPLSIAARSEANGIVAAKGPEASDESEEENDTSYRYSMARPSEQWEVVMESIEEQEEGSSQGTLSSQRTLGASGEFGTGSSKSTSTMGSSIRALATSLGLKRNTSKSTVSSAATKPKAVGAVIPARTNITDELSQSSAPYSSLPPSTSMPQTDHFTFTPMRLSPVEVADAAENPLPGHALRPGVPAPANARLSLGLGLGAPSTPTRTQPTTTIRLISNSFSKGSNQDLRPAAEGGGTPQLKPFETTFDLIMGSPTPSGVGFGFGSLNNWLPSNQDNEDTSSIYPKLTIDDLPPVMPDVTPSKPRTSPNERQARNMDMIGSFPKTNSPNIPTVEMTPKSSVEPFIFGSPLPQHRVSNSQFRSAAVSVLEEMNKRLQDQGVDGVGFDLINNLRPGVHTQADLDMQNAALSQGEAKRGEIMEKFEKLHDQEFQKMEGIDGFLKRRSPSKAGEKHEQVVTKKRKSSVLGNGAGRDAHGRKIPGVVVGRASGTRVISNGRRARVLPGGFGDDDSDSEDDGERDGKRAKIDEEAKSGQEENKQKEEAEDERRQKEREREAIKRRLEINKAKRRSSLAAGGLQGRRSGRVSVGRGGVLIKPKPKPSRFGFLSSAKSIVQSVWGRGKPTAPTTSIPKPTLTKQAVPTREAPKTFVTTKPSNIPSTASGSRLASVRAPKDGASTASTSRSRSPLPSFAPVTGTRSSRNSVLTGTSRNGSLAGTEVSSVGKRLSSTTTGGVGSMGSKKLLGSASGRASAIGSTSSSRISSVSSRLHAPTVSSLAKMNRPSTSALKPVDEDRKQHNPANVQGPKTSSALGSITNSHTEKRTEAVSPKFKGIFTQPLEFTSGIPTPVKRGGSNIVVEQSISTQNSNGALGSTGGLSRQRTIPGRKPRISRSKVIAKLASQRATANGTSSSSAGLAVNTSQGGGRTRSSMGAKVQRTSFAGGKRGSGAGDILMSAKKRARQSEYARRRSSRVEASNSMDVDNDE